MEAVEEPTEKEVGREGRREVWGAPCPRGGARGNGGGWLAGGRAGTGRAAVPAGSCMSREALRRQKDAAAPVGGRLRGSLMPGAGGGSREERFWMEAAQNGAVEVVFVGAAKGVLSFRSVAWERRSGASVH